MAVMAGAAGRHFYTIKERSAPPATLAKPRASGVLILEVDEWPANTRLYKAIDQAGLQIDCRPPQKPGKSK